MSDISHRTKITLETLDEISDVEKELMKTQLEWICETHLIPLKQITVEEQ